MIERNKKTRYYDFGEAVIASLHGESKKLLFHVCCGPCACFPLTCLCPHFDVTIYYCNPNIYPSEEYERRLGELKKLLAYLKRDYGFEIELFVPPYDPEAYFEFIKPYEHLPEGSERCHRCYEYRMGLKRSGAEAGTQASIRPLSLHRFQKERRGFKGRQNPRSLWLI